jgi:hypothetical protein
MVHFCEQFHLQCVYHNPTFPEIKLHMAVIKMLFENESLLGQPNMLFSNTRRPHAEQTNTELQVNQNILCKENAE